jgi:hypothetical protein
MIERVPSKQADEYWSLTPDTLNQVCPAASEVQANKSIPTTCEKGVKKGVNMKRDSDYDRNLGLNETAHRLWPG